MRVGSMRVGRRTQSGGTGQGTFSPNPDAGSRTMRSCRLKILATAAAFAGVVAFAASPAFAVHDIEPFPGAGVDTFELDNGTDGGNAIDESDINAPNDPTPFPDDWGKIDMGV